MKQRNGRMMVLAGVALCDLAVGSMAAALAGESSGDLAVNRSLGSAHVAGVAGDGSLSVVAQAVAVALSRTVQDPAVSAAGPTSGTDAAAVVAAAVAAPVTVAPPATEATVPPSTATTLAAAPPTTEAPAPAATVAVASAVEADTAAQATAPPATPAAGTASGYGATDAIAAWFPDVYDQALRVARCESSLNPDAVSRGGGNHGLFQINSVHRGSFEAITGQPWSMVYDPYYNAQYARHLYDASGWRPWGCRP